MPKGRAPVLTKCLITDKNIIADHYYEREIASRKCGLPVKYLKSLSQTRSSIIPCQRFQNKVYFDKYIIDDMAEGILEYPRKKSIVMGYADFFQDRVMDMSCGEHVYAITIAFKAKGYNYTNISATGIVKDTFHKVSYRIYKEASKKRNCGIDSIGIMESPDSYPHYHGVISLPEKVRNLQGKPDEEPLLEDWVALGIEKEIDRRVSWPIKTNPSVVVTKLYSPSGWVRYLSKQTNHIKTFRNDEDFEFTTDKYIF